ncbi:uncharacterized protein EV420DRAFT_1169069 [Desarmillaria tabescens]|uniref:Uncharacterized protein n=1 Tax=Armillaria tabescens TaxID=1929756 RepID=A0AA39MLZ3_ARMTA|nr:uncharacterized protein EV420DRAFT_1169069 [Desarmillaria tabescens]KAK0439726.1 hypothetical protein EV420DRAFT_1169069 [Desarmillaria tabescens]
MGRPIYITMGNCLSISSSGERSLRAVHSWKGYTPFVDKYIKTGVKAVNANFDDCESDMDDADSGFNEDDGDQSTKDIDTALAPPMTEPSWPDFECQNLQRVYEEPYSADHPLQNPSIMASLSGSSPRTALASLSVDDIDPPAEETTAEPLDGVLSPVSYREKIHETEVQGAEPLGLSDI